MPPSEFTNVSGFTRQIDLCFRDLEAEVAAGEHPSFEVGARRELKSLNRLLPASPGPEADATQAALYLARAGYRFLEGRGGDRNKALKELETHLKRLHVTDEGQLVLR